MSVILAKVLAEIAVLSRAEQRKVREKVSEWLAEDEPPELRLQKSLYAAGLLNEVKQPRSESRQHNLPLLEVAGPLVSQTIIEERR